jgi:hypothetical protein
MSGGSGRGIEGLKVDVANPYTMQSMGEPQSRLIWNQWDRSDSDPIDLLI